MVSKMYELAKNEELILLVVFKLNKNAYGVTIRKMFMDITGKNLNFGSMYNTLYLLVRRGFITSENSDPVSKKGGKRKKLYFLTKDGLTALQKAQDIQKLAWDDMPDLAIGKR